MTEAEPRSARKWAILLMAWAAGLCVFALYLGLMVYLVYRWFS
jgi:hypothetical protein